ncbi:MAG: hypothetical protein KAR06_06365 [Deltaproteobacteria bacterium]|nr:hypothetical protein [Deltaproteobacteria bacterium]
MTTTIGESIKVMAVFDKGPRPVKFKWKGKSYPVREITYTWSSRSGTDKLLHFSLTDGASLFEITYNQSSMLWLLQSIADCPS